jgi:putative ABC transport system permease protein
MRILAILRSSWLMLTRRDRAERSLDDELHAYVDLLAEEYERVGTTPAAARRRALVAIGGVEQVKDATRDAWIGNGIATAIRELRFSLRALRNAPVFTLIAVGVLAIGVGGATAIFTVIKGSLLRQLPGVSRPLELVSLEPTKGNTLLYDFSYLDYRDLREQSRTLAGLAGYDGTSMALDDRAGRGRSTWVSYVTGNFFAVLGATPAVGRLIQPADESEANRVVVLAYDLWQSRYSGDPAIIGSTIDLAEHPMTVIGVAQPGFIGAMLMHPMELWFPLTAMPSPEKAPGLLDSHADTYLRLVGRLAEGNTIGDAQRELSLLAQHLADSYPVDQGHGIRVLAGAGMTVDERTGLAKLPRLLAAAVGLLLLIACANVANLSLVRASARTRELATRLALGASWRSLVGRLLLEGSVLAALGGLFGVGLARILVGAHSIVDTVAGMPTRVGLDVTLDRRVLGVAFAASVFTALVVSIAPVLHVMHVQPGSLLKDGAAGAVRRRSLTQRALVAAQAALSLVLLASAAIVFSTFHRMLATDLGFDPRGLTTVSPDLREAQRDSARTIAYREGWLRQAAEEPTIANEAVASVVPPADWTHPRWIFRGGQEPPPGTRLGAAPAGGMRAYLDVVSPGFFDVMRLPIAAGRGFAKTDDDRAEPVAMVSRRFAADMWPNESPLGKMLSLPAFSTRRAAAMRVIGIVQDIRFASIFDAPPPVVYVPVAQHDGGSVSFVLRTRRGAAISDSTIRRIGASVDPRVAMFSNTPVSLIDEQLRPQHIASTWIAVFGGIALVLAAIGLYGVVAQGVLQRRRELAVRSALGASPRGLASLVVGDGMRIAAIGGAVGAVATMGAERVLQSQFAGVSLVDAWAAVVATGTLCLAMMTACYVPALRASRLDPADALRCD